MVTRRNILKALAVAPLAGLLPKLKAAESPLLSGEIGRYEGFRFIETNPVWSRVSRFFWKDGKGYVFSCYVKREPWFSNQSDMLEDYISSEIERFGGICTVRDSTVRLSNTRSGEFIDVSNPHIEKNPYWIGYDPGTGDEAVYSRFKRKPKYPSIKTEAAWEIMPRR